MGTLERLCSRVQTHVHFQASLRGEGIAAHVAAEEFLTCEKVGQESARGAGQGRAHSEAPHISRRVSPTGR